MLGQTLRMKSDNLIQFTQIYRFYRMYGLWFSMVFRHAAHHTKDDSNAMIEEQLEGSRVVAYLDGSGDLKIF